jgi:hypothetical protein
MDAPPTAEYACTAPYLSHVVRDGDPTAGGDAQRVESVCWPLSGYHDGYDARPGSGEYLIGRRSCDLKPIEISNPFRH